MANEETEQKNEETAQKAAAVEEEKKEPEPKEYNVHNPCRMLRQQESKVVYI